MNKNNTLLHKIKGYRHGGWVAPAVDPSATYAAMVGNLASAWETQIESVDRAKDREVIKTTNKNADDIAKKRKLRFSVKRIWDTFPFRDIQRVVSE